ncbi:MAG: glycoside hydrolase N-terminal domain-containing protein [Sedimentisphaerales bacterium]|nr:glycoside hydrolase N-terminal domain-containing protein [Sedimentisphaerales bacterium]
MKNKPVTLIAACLCLLNAAAGMGSDLKMWYDKPAGEWMREALPIGNGRLGAMIFGGQAKEHIQFNEDSLWIGDESDTGAYQAFGNLFIELGDPSSSSKRTGSGDRPASGQYRRELDLARGVHTVAYNDKGINFKREYFASYPDQVLVFRLTADKKGMYSGTVTLTDMHEGHVSAEGNKITSKGSLAGYVYGRGSNSGKKNIKYNIALCYEAQVLVLHEGGSVTASNGKITFEQADSLTILLVADTDYLNRRAEGWKGEHPHQRLEQQLKSAAGKSYDDLLGAHITDYKSLFDRCVLDIGSSTQEKENLPTDQRLAAYKTDGSDPGLEELVFQYARYLMIASSRPGALPANLQGLWNMSNTPPWRSDYHTDVNIQMNYWFTDHANLSECFLPLAEWVHSIREVRKAETKATFGTRGWISHAENGVFGGSTWKWLKGDAAWVAQNLWDHYAYTGDQEYLRLRAYPVMKELCQFWEDHLKALPDGTLVSPDGFSPEHGPHEDGVSFDQQLVWDLFTNFTEASEILGKDEAFRKKIASMKSRLLGPKIGKWGQLQEWMVDRDNPKDQHRHLSHMIAVHPGRQISPITTPEFAEAAQVSMNARGDGSTGWSRAWKVSIWARLHDGDRAYSILKGMLQAQFADNLFDMHPPFQIDGNFGYAAGICEMIVQSHIGDVHLLPALPSAWGTGSVKGIRARTGFVLNMEWQDARLRKCTLLSELGKPCRLRTQQPVTVSCGCKSVKTTRISDLALEFDTSKGSIYEIVPR